MAGPDENCYAWHIDFYVQYISFFFLMTGHSAMEVLTLNLKWYRPDLLPAWKLGLRSHENVCFKGFFPVQTHKGYPPKRQQHHHLLTKFPLGIKQFIFVWESQRKPAWRNVVVEVGEGIQHPHSDPVLNARDKASFISLFFSFYQLKAGTSRVKAQP